MAKNNYEVIVGNVGRVCSCFNYKYALKTFRIYKRYSKTGYGRSSGESIDLYKNGEVIKQHIGTIES